MCFLLGSASSGCSVAQMDLSTADTCLCGNSALGRTGCADPALGHTGWADPALGHTSVQILPWDAQDGQTLTWAKQTPPWTTHAD